MKIILYIRKIDPTQTLYIYINILSTLLFSFLFVTVPLSANNLPYYFPSIHLHS